MSEEEEKVLGPTSRAKFVDDDVEDVEEDDETEEDVLVGVPTNKNLDALDNFYARIGGDAVLSSSISCSTCRSGPLVEILSVSAPFHDLVERFITLVCCKTCEELFAFRRQSQDMKSAPNETKDEPVTLKQPLWGQADSDAPSDQELEALFASSKIGDKEKTAKTRSKPAKSASKTKCKVFEFVYEPLPDEEELAYEKELLARYNREAREQGEETFKADKTVSLGALGRTGDPDDFVTRLQLEPQQRLRYGYGSLPLVPDKAALARLDNVKPCKTCGAKRNFEFQVTPQAIEDIRKITEIELDFSTIIVFTCARSCDEGIDEEVIVSAAF